MSDEHHRIPAGEARKRFNLVLRKLGLPEDDDGSFRDDTLRALEILADLILRISRDEAADVETDERVLDLTGNHAAVEKTARALYDAFEGGRVRAINSLRKSNDEEPAAWEGLDHRVRTKWMERAIELLRGLV